MNTHIINQQLNALYILLLLITLGAACKKDLYNPGEEQTTLTGGQAFANSLQATLDTLVEGPPSPDEVVAWRKPDKTEADYAAWLDSTKKKYGSDINENDPCESCDNTLVVLKGKGVRNYIQTGGTVAGSTTSTVKPPAVGEDGPMYVSRNYHITFSKPVISSVASYNALQDTTYTGTTVKIAILDTGTDTSELTNFKYHSLTPPCIMGADSGWNFVRMGANYTDDNSGKHGTIVTRFITDEVVKYRRNKVEILPVKTHTQNGVSDLARILCALAYAQQRGAKIINASFGFYIPQDHLKKDTLDPNAKLIKEFVKHYLTKKGILLVTAAGNKDDLNEKQAFDLEGLPYTSAPRNLDSVGFLPASLAQLTSLQNVITVTTVKKSNGTVSPRQNFSPNAVDMGVNADAIINKSYAFNNPLLDSTETVEGSSFATAIMTGILAANYDKYKSVLRQNNYTKEQIWAKLGTIIKSDTKLADKIKGGRYVKK